MRSVLYFNFIPIPEKYRISGTFCRFCSLTKFAKRPEIHSILVLFFQLGSKWVPPFWSYPARATSSIMKRVANDVFEMRCQGSHMMLVKDMENAQPNDPQAFFPAAGTNIQQPQLSKQAQRLIANRGKGMSPDPSIRKPREQKSGNPEAHTSPPKGDKK